ncbi:MAG: hypothetical protein HC903_13820 [Methylacidiphilales bacterium]|nr:hypothetical protein [Candidatus Methylacidiphilales bacterium]NJR19445.1 hypothetical protein [Calothrix sp. CSU_2_0]
MTEPSNLQLIIDFNDFDLDDDEKDEQVRNLRQELEGFEGIETVKPVSDLNPPIGHKAIGSIITGILMAEVNPANLAKLFAFLSDRLGNKPIKLKLKTPDGRELEVEASSKEEIEYAIAQAEKFIKQQ